MNSIQTLRLLALAGLGSILAAPVLAQDGSYYYGGLSLGQSRAKIDEPRISASLLGTGLTTNGFARDEKSNAYRLFGGYQFNRYFGLEAGYFDLGKFGFNTTTTPAGTLHGQIKVQGLNLDLVGTLPLTERFSLIGRVGAQMARSRDTFSGTGSVNVLDPNPSKREINPKFGAGLQYAFSPGFVMRGEAERYRINDAVGNHGGVNVVSVSLVFPFGRAPAPAPRAAAPAYVPVAVAPAPEPVIVVPAPVAAPVAAPVVAFTPPVVVPPPKQRVSFSAESLFGFDKSTIKPEGRVALDNFARETSGTRFDVITVEGHTDRLGSEAYNQKLSLQRAEAVKAYLIGSGGLDAGKVNAVGKGESQPTTAPDACKGSKPTSALIACLQPDRRVDVEVTGTR
jgi:OOP family OmpA-OmpF porin